MSPRPPQKALTDFLGEAQETVETLDRGLLRLEDSRHGDEADPEVLNAVFRAAHTLKGVCAMAGVERVAKLAHALEDRLDELRMGRAALDGSAIVLLLSTPALFGKLITEEAAGARTDELTGEADALARRLRGEAEAPPAQAADPLDRLALAPAMRQVLTGYEEHRLRAGIAKGLALFAVRVALPLDTFDTALEALKTRLKAGGEVVAALPSAGSDDPDVLRFDVLFVSSEPLERAIALAGPQAQVSLVAAGEGGAPPAPSRADARPAASPAARETGAGAPAADEATTAPARPAGEASARGGEAAAAAPGPRAGPGAQPPVPSAPAHPGPGPGVPGVAPPGAAPSATSGQLRAAVPAAPGAPAAAAPRAAPTGAPVAPHPIASDGPSPEASLRSVTQAVRVDIAKLDRLMNLVGELVLVKTSLLAIASRLRSGDGASTLGLELHRESRALERKLQELQGGILEVRMVPLEQIFDKLSRMVRKLSRDLGKAVDLEVRGGEVELDKLIVEELSDPLMHLIRNALDHAIEPADVRQERGKPPRGRIWLSAEQRGNHVVIGVEDDGGGIDPDRVREAALLRGFLSTEAAEALSARELVNLIFVPGFSTAKRVSALSGRGVGMDVVKSNIAAMSGIIDVDTEPGVGTRFEITLPVTLAIIRALVVSAGRRTYAVPLNSVLEIVTVTPAEVRTLSGREVLDLRGATLPLVRLGALFGTAAERPTGSFFVVVVGLAQERLGFVVESLVGQQDIVVKPLGRALDSVRGIAGATDLGNRQTILVLDVGAIIEETLHPGENLVEAI